MSNDNISEMEEVCPIVIDASHSILIIDRRYLEQRDTRHIYKDTSVFNHTVLGKVYNQGRWTQVEHLVFLACIIEFGRDWKMIEEFVQTRSSSQARSHAQKVLRKMERAGIVREIKALKNKLKFDAKAHK
jgi:SHAQKYF class myb-like DNA-binding protein